ncbi:unnamed protein product [Blepharisma stoltei]|uniref:Uncharacterized protein n=1 Tax=Blepharisma stoltei TaxID=1481888 RepID=A0AAU9IAF2_9CILI|nr:unnamed protein product [Blepharisma stoltei]
MNTNYLRTNYKIPNFTSEERLFYLGRNQEYEEESSIVRLGYDEKKSPTHRSTYSIDEFKLKALSTPNKPSHKRTISGTHAYFTELRSFGSKSPPSNSEKSDELNGNCCLSKYTNNQVLPELCEYDETPVVANNAEEQSQTDFPEQESPLGLEVFEEMMEIISSKDSEKSKNKAKRIRQLKEILLEKLKKSSSFDSASFSKNELLSTERLSELIKSSFTSNRTQVGPGSSILLNEPSIEAPEYNNFLKGINKTPISYSKLSGEKNNMSKIEEILMHVCKKSAYQINNIKRKMNNAKWAKRFVVIFNSSENSENVGVYGKEFINFRKIDGDQSFPENVFKPQIERELVFDEENELKEIDSEDEADAVILYKS